MSSSLLIDSFRVYFGLFGFNFEGDDGILGINLDQLRISLIEIYYANLLL